MVVAVDGSFSREVNGLDALGFDIHDFSAFFAAHKINNVVLDKYSDCNLNSALLSDCERAEVYGIWNVDEEDYLERLKSALLCYFEDLFEKYKIDAVLYENVSNAFAHFAYFVATKFGACYCGIGASRLPGRFSITADPLNDSKPAEIFYAIRAGQREVDPEVKEWCKQYLDNLETIVPDYMKINGLDDTRLMRRYLRWDRIKTILTLLRHAGDKSLHAFQMGNPVQHYFNLFKRNVARSIKLKWLWDYYDHPKEGERFILYPLHFHPESSTSILAGTYLNEYEVVRNIAFNLPQGVRLYVKDHISAYGFPAKSFYRNLRRLPNVRVISPTAQIKSLIKRSLAVITLTSTAGYEALLMGKKVFLFGSVFYGFHKCVRKVENPAGLHSMLQEQLREDCGHDRAYNLDFIAAYYYATKPGTLNLMKMGKGANECADSVYDQIREHLTLALAQHATRVPDVSRYSVLEQQQ
ncbi:hypothetical protein GCM10027321_17720 [Massilia terrae]